MTEQQREEDFLSELLDVSEGANRFDAAPARHSTLTRSKERALLHAANQVGPPTLAPQEFEPAATSATGSFVGEAVDFVRRYPVPSLLAGIGIAYLLARRRR